MFKIMSRLQGSRGISSQGNQFSKSRLHSMLLIGGATLLPTLAVSLRCHFMVDEVFCVLFVDLAFLLVFFFELEYERVHGFLADNSQTSFLRLAVGYLVCCVLAAVDLFLPEFQKPVLFFVVLMSALSNASIAMSVSLFLCVMLGLANAGNAMEMASHILLVLTGSFLCKTMHEPKYRVYISFLFFCLPLVIPSIFYYWTYQKITYTIYLYGGMVGLVTAVVMFFLYDMAGEETIHEVQRFYHKIIQEKYVRVQELRKYSESEYQHARVVSNLAGACARTIGINDQLCEAAGFYYRMGKWVGEPHVENGVKRAGQLCFPEDVQQILSEYNGEERAISSKESALVHMVDALVLKGEVMQESVGDSRWNREMLVYQTLNELSASGIYDNSCMSINEFIRARDYLTKMIQEEDESEL